MSSNIETLKDKIKLTARAYYGGEPIVTDDQFDAMVEELRKYSPNDTLLTTPGWGAFHRDDGKVHHIGKYPVSGLDKYKYPDSPEQFNRPGVAELKYDGLTVVVTSVKGKVIAATRNNGDVGKDCTQNLLAILTANYPELLKSLEEDTDRVISIKGEVLPGYWENAHNYIKENKIVSPRNWAAGLMNRDEVSDELKHLCFIPYFIRWDSKNEYKTQVDMLLELSKMGGEYVPRLDFETITPEQISEFYEAGRLQGFNIDGIVISSKDGWNRIGPDFSENEQLSFAYKFESETKHVVVKGLEWATGIKGNIVPTVVYEPVFLGGAQLSRAAGHSAEFVLNSGIFEGAIVEITRSGEVIPYIKSVVKTATGEHHVPSKCPSCNTDTEWQGSHLKCVNIKCSAKARTSIFNLIYFAGNVEGCADATINDWLTEFPVSGGLCEIQDLDMFVPLFIQAGPKANSGRRWILVNKFGEHRGNLLHQLEKNIETKLNNGLFFNEFWFIINLPGLGESFSNKLGQVDPNNCSMLQIENSGVNSSVINSLAINQNHWMRWARLFKLVPAVIKETKSYHFKVVVTGSVSMKRADWVKKMDSLNILVQDKVNAETKYLICNEKSGSSKTKAAEKLGVKVLTEPEFNEVLKGLN